ncbi:helix-turn-helix domain-containing protein [Delftia tsuruhatensis]|uniref:helix-turn-helix domain-containing protein n=1 Tax=Delftia tsuruhatensis TaxID=180282 RepID=UPI0039BCC16F
MNQVKEIRLRLGVTQQTLGGALGCTQTNIGHYERGQMMPTPRARLLINYAAGLGLALTFDHLYGDAPLPDLAPAAAPTRQPQEQGHA